MKLNYYIVSLCAVAVFASLSPTPARAETSEASSMFTLLQSLMNQVKALQLQIESKQSGGKTIEASAISNTRVSSSTAAYAMDQANEAINNLSLALTVASSSASTSPDVIEAAYALLVKAEGRLEVAEGYFTTGRYALSYAAAVKSKQYAEEGLTLLQVGALSVERSTAPAKSGSSSRKLQPRMCQMDVKICADGTTVGRKGPFCTFASCPAPKVIDVPVVCPIDEIICADGSMVSPVGPECAIPACPSN